MARSVASLAALALAALGCGAESTATPVTPVVPGSTTPTAVEPPPAPVSPPCPPGAPDALVMSYAVHGTHGMDFSETLTIACSGEVVLDAPRPWTTELGERPGRYTHHLDTARIEQLRALAVRLAQPVPVPSLPPQGADVTVFVYTSPPASHELRQEGPADGEAAAMRSAITAEIIAALPPLVTCDLGVELRPSTDQLVAGTDGLVVVTLHNPAEHPIHVSFPRLREAIQILTPEGNVATVRPDAIAMFMQPDLRGAGGLAETGRGRRTTLGLAAGVSVFAGLHATFPTAGSVSARARVEARVSCARPTDAEASLPTRTYESPPLTFEVQSAPPR